jgi:signal transduction histidine kinase
MEISNAIVIAAIIHSLVFLALLAIWFVAWRNRFRLFERPLPKAKRLIEQRLVLEALAAFAIEKDRDHLISQIGKHAAETNGFNEWIAWVEDDERRFRIAEVAINLESQVTARLSESNDRLLYEWVAHNASPLFLRPFVAGFAGNEAMRLALGRLSNGVLIPFVDGEDLIGFVITGGERPLRERRSGQFLSLFGAIAAISLKKAALDERERSLLKDRQRSETLASLGKMAARLAHEIRNPLTFIRSATDYLDSDTLDPDKRKTLTSGIAEEIERINQRVQELLSLGRIDPQNFTSVDLHEVISKSAGMAEAKAREKGISIELRLNAKPAIVAGDADRLWQLFENLIINAIDAIVRGGKIVISSERRKEEIVVDIADNGPGIEEGIAAHIFDPFFSTKTKGSGLGLAIVYSIARAHGGSIELLKTSPEGTCFRVTLPPAGRTVR